METYEACIYHCLACGRIVHGEPETEPPRCCGTAMGMVVTETIREGDDVEETPGGQSK